MHPLIALASQDIKFLYCFLEVDFYSTVFIWFYSQPYFNLITFVTGYKHSTINLILFTFQSYSAGINWTQFDWNCPAGLTLSTFNKSAL